MLKLVIVVAACAGWAGAQDLVLQMDEYIGSQVRARKFMGSVLVAREGNILLKKGYGMANLEHELPNRPETKFRLGSITKQFVAAGILQLEENGKLSVNDSVCRHIPDCPPAWKPVTIHHLLSHTSGITNFTNFADYAKTWMLPSRPEQTMSRFRDKPLEFEPGQKWSYSNSGYILLGYLLEKVSGQKYEDYLRKNIFDKSGMVDSGHDTHEEILKNRATGYSRRREDQWINSAYHDMSIPIGGGDLYSTVEDLYKWDQALTTDKVLTKASIAKLFTPVKNGYGYGWAVDKQYGRARQAHGGGINGFATYLARFPEQRVMVAVLGNMDFANSAEIASELVRIVFGEKLIRPEDRKVIPIDVSKLGDYAGQYELMPGVNAVISVEDGKLFALLPGALRAEVFPEAADRFFFKTTDRVLSFPRDAQGKVMAMVTHRAGTEQELRKITSDVPETPSAVTVPAEDLAGLTGEYELAAGFSIVVTSENGKLFAQATGQQRFALSAESRDKFFFLAAGVRIEFRRGPDGQADQLTLHQMGRQLTMKRK